MSGAEPYLMALAAGSTAYAATRKPPQPQKILEPTVDKSVIDREAQDLAMRRRGRAATVLAGDSTAPPGSVAVKQLLGS